MILISGLLVLLAGCQDVLGIPDVVLDDPPRCGDGNTDEGEQCDGRGESTTCDDDCTFAMCGDGDLNEAASEVCEPGPAAPDCEDDCTLIECGDDTINPEAGEQCDDGNREDGDFCSKVCVAATCGDGVQNGDELDQDCGGHCGPGTCRSGQGCESDSDCTSGDCRDGMCRIEPMVATGGAHTCALVEDGTVRCWGDNESGQLGHGHTRNIGDDEAAASAGDVDAGGTVVQVVAGGAHTCALLEGGKVRCWGANEDGQLGQGNDEVIGDSEPPGAAPEVDVGGLVAALAAGGRHTCALLESGDVRCWGSNIDPEQAACRTEPLGGQLGYPAHSRVGVEETPAGVEPVDVGGRVQQITAGWSHTCALLEDGKVRCWGVNSDCHDDDHAGWLGQGNRESVGDDETPASVGVIELAGTARQIVAGRHHTCALLDTGEVRCWGARYDGQLGLADGRAGNVGDDETPASVAPVDVGGPVARLAAGANHTCALLEAGTVRCWGDSTEGQLGYGHMNRVGDDEVPASSGDVAVGGDVVHMAAGGAHSCALLASGAIRCWGANAQGQLGHGHSGPIGRGLPMEQAGAVDVGVSAQAVASNGSHTCARVDGQNVRCWGLNRYGQLGYGHMDNIGDGLGEVPAGAGDVNVGGAVVQIATGESHSCALLAGGGVRCWGFNEYGQLGYGNTDAIGDDLGEVPAGAGDVNVGGAVVQLVAGEAHTCALLEGGRVRCWGANWDGQLGYPGVNRVGTVSVPADVGDVNVGGVVMQLTAGEGHTCALLEGGAVRCWGLNNHGQLGYGHTFSIGYNQAPADVGDVDVGGVVVQLTAGEIHTCALLASGVVRCWGANGAGRLGYGHTDDIGDDPDELPAGAGEVSVGGAVVQLSAGGEHTCALLAGGALRCWGSNLEGQLGHDYALTVGDDEVPASARLVDIEGTAIQVATGSTHTCAVLDTGVLRCWGANWAGQLGYGHTSAIGAGLTIIGAGDVPYR